MPKELDEPNFILDKLFVGNMINVGDGNYCHIDKIQSMSYIETREHGCAIKIIYSTNSGVNQGIIKDQDKRKWYLIQDRFGSTPIVNKK